MQFSSSLAATSLFEALVPVNAQLRRLNAHLWSTMESSFRTPVEVTVRVELNCIRLVSSASRLSSFGFSGTIAHGAFCALREAVPVRNQTLFSLHRASVSTW
jgi:hypothetical protein